MASMRLLFLVSDSLPFAKLSSAPRTHFLYQKVRPFSTFDNSRVPLTLTTLGFRNRTETEPRTTNNNKDEVDQLNYSYEISKRKGKTTARPNNRAPETVARKNYLDTDPSETEPRTGRSRDELNQLDYSYETSKRKAKTTRSKPESLARKKPLEIDPAVFAAKSFSELGLPSLLLERLKEVGFTEPTDVQSTAIPTILNKHDVVIQSYTGSGKTLAYLLPILSEIGPLRKKESTDTGKDGSDMKRDIEALIVAPSRELGMQIVREIEKLLGPTEKRAVQQLVGGANRWRQEEALKKNKPVIVVGTPGRIAEISASGKLHTHGCRFLVLDEVDELLAFNFREDMHRILEHVGRRAGAGPKSGDDSRTKKSERQTVLVSATVPYSVVRAARSWGQDPVLVKAKSVTPLEDSFTSTTSASDTGLSSSGPLTASSSSKQQTQAASESLPPSLTHYYCVAKGQHKVDTLRRCVHALDARYVIVFMNHIKQLKDTVYKLNARGMDAEEMHGDLNKLSRMTIMRKFKNGELRVLVTNELAARGLDVPECDLVVNLELPTDSVHYAHRAGRTGRLGRKGVVVNVCEQSEVFVVKKLERQLGVRVQSCEFVEGKLLVAEDEERVQEIAV